MTADAPKDAVNLTRAFDEEQLEGARIYAEALLNAADKEGVSEEALRELTEIREDILERYPAFAALLVSNSLSIDRRDTILGDALGGRALPVVERFLRVLNRHNRLELVGPILILANQLLDRRLNRRPVLVKSAVALDDGQVEALRGRLAPLLAGATPILTIEVDPALIGGIVVQIGDDLYDMSVRSRLTKLRKQLVEAKFREIRGQGSSFVSA